MRFTLQPIFANPARQFRCHLARRRPHISYQLWFYVSVHDPDNNKVIFETPRLYVNVSLSTPTSGPHATQFLSVYHVTGLNLTDDDVILTGRRNDVTAPWNYTVFPVYGHVTRDSGDAWRQIESHAISNNIRVLTAQPDRPFAFSTSSWAAQSTSCNVDVTRFRPVNKMSRSSGEKVTADVTSHDGRFTYRLYRLKSSKEQRPLEERPRIKFLIPGFHFI